MINQVNYTIDTDQGPIDLTITPVNTQLPNGDFYATGVFKLTDGVVGMGDITFDNEMNEWNYDGFDEFTWEEVAKIATFIKNYKDPEGADPDKLQ